MSTASGEPQTVTPDATPVINVVLLGKNAIVNLNRTYLGQNESTDVIAFDLFDNEAAAADDEYIAGEIYICLDVAVEAAREYGTSVGYEVVLYFVHGMLHLNGYDDQDTNRRRRMRAAETRIMKQLGNEFSLHIFSPPHACSNG